MISRKHAGLAVAILVFAAPVQARDDAPEDTPKDTPSRVATEQLHAPVRLAAEGRPIDSGASLGHSGPTVEDVDGDGLRDLIVGDFSGLFRIYRNLGTNQAPRYAAAVNLRAGTEDAKVPIY